MRTIAIINQKGGCGKTTSAINLSAVLARQGKRVLLVDMDPQSHCAAGLGIPEQRIEMDIGDAMLAIGNRPIDPARLLWRAVRNLDLAPSRMRLASLEAAKGGLAEFADKHRRLLAVLEKFKTDYDIAVIDCSPAIGLLTYNALAAADMALIPVETGFFSLQGANRQLNTVKSVSKKLGVAIPACMLPTLHDPTNTVACDLLDEMHRRYRDRIIPVVVRRDTRLREAASFGQTIVDYAPGSSGAEDYGRLGVWVSENLVGRKPLAADAIAETESAIELDGFEVAKATMNTATTQQATAAALASTSITETSIAEPKVQLPATATTLGAGNAAATSTTTTATATTTTSEAKPMTRAEDVARRAQEFLRRIANGRSAAAGTATAATNATNTTGNTAANTAANQATAQLQQAFGTQVNNTQVNSSQAKPMPTAATNTAAAASTQLTGTLPNAATQKVALPATTITMANGIAAPGPATTSPIEPKPIDASQGPVLLEARNVLEMIDEPATVMPVHSSADRLLGVRDTSQGLLFVQPIASGKRIAIAGAFNNWSTTEHVMKRNEQLGVHELCIRLPKGTFAYRLVIDGQWTHDVHNPTSEPNPFGELNSIAHVESGALVTT
jgi:chromosome partitioning protein